MQQRAIQRAQDILDGPKQTHLPKHIHDALAAEFRWNIDMNTPLKIAIIGTGAMGSIYAARLSNAGHSVCA